MVGVEEDDGGDEFGVCGSEGEGEGEGEGDGPAANQRAWVGMIGGTMCGKHRAVCQRRVQALVR